MQSTVIRPPESLIQVADLVEKGIREVVHVAPGRVGQSLGQYEAPIESLVLITLQARYLESIVELARRDVVLLPAALVLARSTLEIGGRVLWLLHPDDPFEAEARWLAHLKTEEDWLLRARTLVEELGADSTMYANRADVFRDFRLRITAKLPAGTDVPKQVPNFREVLRSLGEEKKYLAYLQLSQFVHGAYTAGGLYRGDLRQEGRFSEDIQARDWRVVFTAAWPAFVASAGFLYAKHLDSEPPITSTLDAEVQKAIEAIS